jgi:DNA-binding NarL/FixJ family response regulator
VLASSVEATTVLRRLARVGWQTREGFALPESSWDVTSSRLVLFGRVSDLDTAELALLAAARGAGVIAIADVRAEVGRALLADLERIGPVSTDPDAVISGATPATATGSAAGSAAPTSGATAGAAAAAAAAGSVAGAAGGDHGAGTPLAPEQRALLERLAKGETIAAAAQAEFLSLRTANRRIAEARQALGVRSTREAVLAYLRLRRDAS